MKPSCVSPQVFCGSRRQTRCVLGSEAFRKITRGTLHNMEMLPAPPGLATGQTSPQCGSRGRSLGRTEQAKASGNALDKPTSVCSEMASKYVESLASRRANDGRRPSADASRRCCPRPHAQIDPQTVSPRGLASQPRLTPRVHSYPSGPYEDLSRMKGNFHVRLLEGASQQWPASTRRDTLGTRADLSRPSATVTFTRNDSLRPS
jgi:hypothetical protein